MNDGAMVPSSGARRGVAVAATCSFALGCVALLGWWIGSTALISIADGLPSMVPNTAAALVLAGVSLWALGARDGPAAIRRLGRVCAAVVLAFGVVVLAQYVFAWDLGFDRLLLSGRVDFPGAFPGRSSPNTALCCILIGLSLLSLPVKTRRACLLLEWSALLAAAFAATALTGYVFGVGYFYGLPPLLPFTGMALHTALALVALCAGLLMARPDCMVLSTLTAKGPGGVLLRRLLPYIVLIPLAIGRLFLLGADIGAYPIAASFLFASAITTLLLGAMLWVSAARMNLLDEARQRAEEARAFLATVAQASDDAVIGTSLDGTILSWNRAAERLYGYDACEVIGKKLPVLGPPERAREAEAILARLRRGERVERYEIVSRTKGGESIHIEVAVSSIVDASGRVTGVSTICRDIGRRKAMEAEIASAHEAERRIRRAEANERKRLEAVVEQLPEAAILVDAKGRLISCNKLALQYASSSVDEPDPWGNRLRFEHRTPAGEPLVWDERPLIRALQRGEVVAGVEGLLRRADRGLVPVLVSAAPVRSDDGELQGAVAVFQDISALKEMERQRQEWIGVIAHDLRQPIQVIATASQLLGRAAGEKPVADCRKQLDRITSSIERLRRMIDDLLDASRIEARQLTLDRSPVNLRAQLGEILEKSAEVTAGHALRLEVNGDVPAVLADPGRLEQIVTNLLSNAAKYGRPEGDIAVTVGAERASAHIAVTNWGGGIPEASLPYLFKRFSRAPEADPRSVRGVGLGLYITKGLVEAHGGTISVESSPGGATTFRFSLPLAPEFARAAGA
ncbi:PAS domain-containing sensor histidine kinase [Sorangium sp. So ce426]|uniref:sensor histidine kinase n=1 Tax=Sorangium sp. So ce426 TaxID=3133312 RepID=UPI003F5B458D